MLFNLEILESQELQELFVRECEHILEGIENKDQTRVRNTYLHLSAIVNELRRRGKEQNK